ASASELAPTGPTPPPGVAPAVGITTIRADGAAPPAPPTKGDSPPPAPAKEPAGAGTPAPPPGPPAPLAPPPAGPPGGTTAQAAALVKRSTGSPPAGEKLFIPQAEFLHQRYGGLIRKPAEGPAPSPAPGPTAGPKP